MPNHRSGRWHVCACLIAAIAAVSWTACATPEHASAADRFHGRTMRIIVATGPGGGYDINARLVAGHIARHLPGTPTVIVENMPGAGGLIAFNHVAIEARPDGLTIALMGENAATAQLIGDPGVRYDVRTLPVIGAPSRDDGNVCFVARHSALTLDSWRTARRPLRLASSNRGSGMQVRGMLISTALGLPARPVHGYQGSAQGRLALESGEVDAMCLSFEAYHSLGYEATTTAIVQTRGRAGAPLAGVPLAEELVTSDDGRMLLKTLSELSTLNRFYVAPPGTPDDVLTVLRTAFDETMRDPDMLRAAAEARQSVDATPAAAVTEQIGRVFGQPAAVRARVAALLLADSRD